MSSSLMHPQRMRIMVWLCFQATWIKSLAVCVSIAGVVMVSSDEHASTTEEESKALGYVYLMVSVIAYALYEVRLCSDAITTLPASNFPRSLELRIVRLCRLSRRSTWSMI